METNTTLESVNANSFRLNQPAFILITLLLPFGVVANVLTLYILLWRGTKSNRRIFLLFLTFIDLICCVLGVPLVMVDLALSMMHPSGVLCKMQRFTLYFCNISCLFTLLIIAVERYNSICRQSRPQLNIFQAKKLTLAVVGVSLFLALPVSLVTDRIRFELVKNIYGYVCWYEFPLHWHLYEWAMFIIFWVCLIVIFTLYCLVWKSISRNVGQDGEGGPVETSVTIEQNRSRQINLTLLCASILCGASLSPYLILSYVSWPEGPEYWQMFKLFLIHLWITNCTVKPVIYVIFDLSFRQHLKGIFQKNKDSDSQGTETPEESEN